VITPSTESEKKKLLKLGWPVVIVLAIWTIFSPWGAWKYYRQGKDLERVREANRQLQQDNQGLQREIDLLTRDPAYIEKIAREKHGLLRNNEVVYSFPASKKKQR
jgi:cell division protein FtsB